MEIKFRNDKLFIKSLKGDKIIKLKMNEELHDLVRDTPDECLDLQVSKIGDRRYYFFRGGDVVAVKDDKGYAVGE